LHVGALTIRLHLKHMRVIGVLVNEPQRLEAAEMRLHTT
jgi:hypothetical protein